jgi:sodium/hydrogen exchanger 8
VFGTVVSAFVIGYLTYAAGLVGAVTIDTSSPMQALVFGSLLSAVDPVATLSILGNPELNCDPLLYSLVFGESVLNDAVAITLFNTFRDVRTVVDTVDECSSPPAIQRCLWSLLC